MIEETLLKALQDEFTNSKVRIKKVKWGLLLEIIHIDYEKLGRSLFRKRIDEIYNSLGNTNSMRIWRIYDYSHEYKRYLQQASLHVMAQKIDHEGNIISFASADDAYLYIPTFDAELITHDDYDGHHIPSIERYDSNGNKVFPYKQVEYKWLSVLDNSYGVKNIKVKTNENSGDTERIIDIELKGSRKKVAFIEDYQEYL